MSLKQDRTGTRNSEDLRRRINVGAISEATDKVDASVETINKLNTQVTSLNSQVNGLNNSVTNTRNTYVSTNNQSFTEEQKTRARNNIGAGNSSFSGSYNDLTNKPTIPTKTSQLTNDSNFITNNVSTLTVNDSLTVGDIKTYTNGIGNDGNLWIDANGEIYGSTVYANGKLLATQEYVDSHSESGSSNAIYQEYHTDYSGYMWFNDGLLVQWGRTSVTPTAVNTDTTARITYTYSYDSIPDRKTEVSSATPSVAKVASGGGTTTSLSKQGMNIYVNSTTTKAVTVDWLATGYKGT